MSSTYVPQIMEERLFIKIERIQTSRQWSFMKQSRSTLALKFSSLLRRCRRHSAASIGQQIHTRVLIHNLLLTDPTLQTDLILMYCRCGDLSSAHQLFDQIPQRSLHSWNILIYSHVQSSLYHRALSLFPRLIASNLTPDHFTLPSLFKACAALRRSCYGFMLHCWAVKLGLVAHVVVITSILDMYLRFEFLDDARKLFDEMRDKDVVVWNSMIAGFARCGLWEEVVSLFRRLQSVGGEMDGMAMAIPSVLNVCGKGGELRKGKEVHGRVVRCLLFGYDVVIGNSLIEMYAKCGCADDSYKVFLSMGDRRNVVTWSTMISCYGVHGKGHESLVLFYDMMAQGFTPNYITFTSVLSSCSHSGLLDEGQAVFDLMTNEYGLEPSIEHYSCMVDILGRAGRISEALKVIEDVPVEPLASVWGALLAACAIHRRVDVAELAAHKLFHLEPGNSSNYVALCGIYEMVGMRDNVAKMRARMRELGMLKIPGCSWIDIKGRIRVFYQGDVPSSEIIHEFLDGLCRTMAPRSSVDSDHEHYELEGS